MSLASIVKEHAQREAVRSLRLQCQALWVPVELVGNPSSGTAAVWQTSTTGILPMPMLLAIMNPS